MASSIKVEGVPELEAAFARMAADTKRGVRKSLREAAQPVQERAERLAVAQIRNIGDRWSRMRIGSTGKMLVYVAPRAKRRGGSPRPNLRGLLLNKSMNPALDESKPEVTARIQAAVDEAAARF